MKQVQRLLWCSIMAASLPAGAADERAPSGDPAVLYNLGTLQHRDQQYAAASPTLERALGAAGDPSLRARAAYNLGNTQFRLAQEAEAAQSQEAAGLYQQAMDHYRLAIRHDPQDRDAQHNYELAQRRLEALQLQPSDQQVPDQQSSDAQPQPSEESSAASEAQGQDAAAAQQAQSQDAAAQPAAAPSDASTPPSEQRQAAEDPAEDAADQGMTKQQALWILDTLQRQEDATLFNASGVPAQERPIERDW